MSSSNSKSNTNANSNDAKRDTQEGGHRMGESIEHGLNSIKRAVVGGSETGDKASETTHKAENRVSEGANRVGDKISEVATNAKSSN